MHRIELGNISGDVEIRLNHYGDSGCNFVGKLKGDVRFSFIGNPAQCFCLELTQDETGGHAISFDGPKGLPINDPSGGVLIQQFFPGPEGIVNGPGTKSIGLWAGDGTQVIAMGYNATSPPSP